jgi:hypothetical protein
MGMSSEGQCKPHEPTIGACTLLRLKQQARKSSARIWRHSVLDAGRERLNARTGVLAYASR